MLTSLKPQKIPDRGIKVVIYGSRTLLNCQDFIEDALSNYFEAPVILRTGGAKGVDRTAQKVGRGLPDVTVMPPLVPNWKLGKHAGLERNKKLADWCDIGIGYWDGKSSGTKHMREQLAERAKPSMFFRVLA